MAQRVCISACLVLFGAVTVGCVSNDLRSDFSGDGAGALGGNAATPTTLRSDATGGTGGSTTTTLTLVQASAVGAGYRFTKGLADYVVRLSMVILAEGGETPRLVAANPCEGKFESWPLVLPDASWAVTVIGHPIRELYPG